MKSQRQTDLTTPITNLLLKRLSASIARRSDTVNLNALGSKITTKLNTIGQKNKHISLNTRIQKPQALTAIRNKHTKMLVLSHAQRL